MVAWIWILIPLAGIALGGFTEWLKYKEKQVALGKSLEKNSLDMLERLDEVIKQQESVIRRIENLETIVTSEEWDSVTTPRLSEAPRLMLPEEEPTSEERAASLARRIRT